MNKNSARVIFAFSFIFLISACASSIKTTRPELNEKRGASTKKNALFSKRTKSVQQNPVRALSDIRPEDAESVPQTTNPNLTPEQIINNPSLSNLNKVEWLVQISTTSLDNNIRELAKINAIEIVNNQLIQTDLERAAENKQLGFARAYALYRLSEQALEIKDFSKAKPLLNLVIEALPGSHLEKKSRAILEQIESSQNVNERTIGAILPLSGKNASAGQKALRGIQMGLGLHLPGSSFKLSVIDSEGSPDTAAVGVERLVKEDGVVAIIGSLLSKTASSVAVKAEELGVPSIALSQKNGITETGSNIFRNALTSEMQIRKLVQYSMNHLKYKKFAILIPNDPYGVEYANIFWDEVLARGGQITGAQVYNPTETDFRFSIQKLTGTYYTEGRADEYKAYLKESSVNKNKTSDRVKNQEDILPPIVDFEAIFIPDDSKNMGQLAAFLAYGGVKNVKLLGTNLWNTPGLHKRAGNFSNGILFVDSIYPKMMSLSSSSFIHEYKSIFNEDPGLLEIQAYDSALILRHLLLSGVSSREELTKRISEIKNFPGSIGPLTMTEEKEINRPLTLLTLENGEITALNPSR